MRVPVVLYPEPSDERVECSARCGSPGDRAVESGCHANAGSMVTNVVLLS